MHNTHIEHVEDLLLAGPEIATTRPFVVLAAVGESLRTGNISALNISTKWDGSPSIVFGPDPHDGKFFVSTKSAFNKVAKVAKTHADIDLFVEGIQPILHVALDELATLHPGIILQGDVLFISTDGLDALKTGVRSSTEPHALGTLSFMPNTICYVVDPGSPTGKRVGAAKIGLALHTQYVSTGATLGECEALPLSPDTFASLRQTPDVFVVDTNYDDLSGAVKFTAEELADFDLAMDAAQRIGPLDQIFTLVHDEPMQTELRKYINRGIRLGYRGKWDGASRLESFWLYLNERKAYEVGLRVSERGQSSIGSKFNGLLENLMLPNVREGMIQWFDIHRTLTDAKTIVIRKLEQAPSDFQTFMLSDSGGWQPTGPEGFVVATGSQAVKLVDRPEFSHRNFKRTLNTSTSP